MTRPTMALENYKGLIGREVGLSNWIAVDQARIDAFADTTMDDQFIHVDPERAKSSLFGGTIAHGFLVISLLSRMAFDALPEIDGVGMSINYGMNSFRFLAPVRAGGRIRGRFLLRQVNEKAPGRILITYDTTVEIENEAKPAPGRRMASAVFHRLTGRATRARLTRTPPSRGLAKPLPSWQSPKKDHR